MSMPKNRSRAGAYYVLAVGSSGPVTTKHDVLVQQVRSSAPATSNKTPFKYRFKAWVYKGQVYTRLAGWVYPKRKPKIKPSEWRDPKPYSCSKEEGNLTHFDGTFSVLTSDPSHIGDLTYYGDLPVSGAPWGSGMVCPALPSSYDSGLESRAVVKALGKLKNQQVNLAVAMAERTETAELLVGTLSGLAKAARSLRRGDMRGVARGLGLSGSPKAPKGQNFHQKWLELQYGWQPLYSDVFGAVSALHRADQDDAKRYTVTVKGSVKSKSTKRARNTPNDVWMTSSQEDVFEGCFVRLDYYLENPFLASLAQLGITNPVEVLWERVPFSFVVDWFLPVGNYLSSMDAALGYKFRGGSCSKLFTREWNAFLLASGKSFPSGHAGPIYGGAHVSQLKLDRSVYSSSPLPRIPSFKNPFPQGSTHIANAIALFASSLRAK